MCCAHTVRLHTHTHIHTHTHTHTFAQAGGVVGVGKEFMRMQGIDLGPPRLPALPLSPEGVKNLKSDLNDIGFFEWA